MKILLTLILLSICSINANAYPPDPPAMPYMSHDDMTLYHQAFQSALEYNHVRSAKFWNNQRTQTNGVIEPTRTWIRFDGAYCRDFEQSVEVGEDHFDAYGYACRNINGYWEL